MAERTRRAFDLEKVTRKFYDRFQKEHRAFLELIEGIDDLNDRSWYASLMLNRLMFIYFIQKKGLLDVQAPGKLDGDVHYLSHKLQQMRQQYGQDRFYTFYRYFLRRLFHEGLSQRVRTAELEALLGRVPYLNGGLFDQHQLERKYPDIQIPDEAFARLFAFLDEFEWHLDTRQRRNDREINPDVLGYIFEKYINQKQMGAYYTKEDITEYISKNTIIPFLFDTAERACQVAFVPDGPVWSLLRDTPDRYIYDAVKKGCDLPLPAEIACGVQDVSQRGEWNKAAPEPYALSTEIWREVVARRTRYAEVKARLVAGEVKSINDLITYNLDICRFAEDVIGACEGVDLLRAFYESIEQVTVLDPTCGSGAFLFAALTILQPLYSACLDRMQDMVEERDQLDAALPADRRPLCPSITHFREILARVAQHPNREYFILKSIIINNLFGVDIMEEATEICKLRLFLKLVAQIESDEQIEPLPDIDFNIRAGNTLVGFASYEEARQVITSQLDFDDAMGRIEQRVKDVERGFASFRALQTRLQIDTNEMAVMKQQLREQLARLNHDLNVYLASQYGVDRHNIKDEAAYQQRFAQWQHSHQPFHWFAEFYGIMERGGFDVIIGNPPYIEYSKVRHEYVIKGYATEACGNLYASVVERSMALAKYYGRIGMIIPHSAFCTDRMFPFMQMYTHHCGKAWLSTYCIRPAKLFFGVDQRLAIALSQREETSCILYSTHYHRWHEEARSHLFTTLKYENVSHVWFPHSIPKIHTSVERSIWEKLSSFKPLREDLVGGTIPIYFHNAPRYWIRAMNFVPYFFNEKQGEQISSHVKSLMLRDSVDADVVIAVLNSSLFYWWFIVLSNCRDLILREIEAFPLGLSMMSTAHKRILGELCYYLMNDYRKYAVRKETKYKTTGKVVYDEFYPRHSKSIIDEIDRVLALHYGFTDEELDTIINYDIAYRIGAEEEEDI